MPDKSTIHHFYNRLTETETTPIVQKLFDQQLAMYGHASEDGQIVEGSLVGAPKQRFTKEEKEATKEEKSAQEICPDEPNAVLRRITATVNLAEWDSHCPLGRKKGHVLSRENP